jgi:glucokinase
MQQRAEWLDSEAGHFALWIATRGSSERECRYTGIGTPGRRDWLALIPKTARSASRCAMTAYPVLEVGGTHVHSSRVDTTTWRVLPDSRHRLILDSSASAKAIIATMASCTEQVCPMPGETLAVAMPGPFEYATGIGRFHDVGKFDTLAGVDVGRALMTCLAQSPSRITFVNDAEAFGLGEWVAGSARGYERVVAITLGSGVGSAFIDAGIIVSSGPSVPPDGHVHHLLIGGRPLEETVSRRAILKAYRSMAPAWAVGLDVSDVAARALHGDKAASRAFSMAFHQLGIALAPWLARFRAQLLVIGGGLTASWSLIDGPLRGGLGHANRDVSIVKSGDSDAAAAVGAVWHSSNERRQ